MALTLIRAFMVIFLSLLTLAWGSPLSFAQEKAGLYVSEELQMELGDHFFQDGDYYRAVTEYKRFLFFFPQSPRADEAQLKILRSYFGGRRWEEAIAAANELLGRFPASPFVPQALFLKGLSLGEKKEFPQARNFLQRVKEISPGTSLADEAQWQMAATYVKEEKWREAAEEFRKIDPSSRLYPRAGTWAEGLERLPELPRKSPTTAGVLAALLPGSGHFYAGRYRDGLVAFFLNGAFIWGMVESFQRGNNVVGGILTFFELGWYSGNIYSAVSGAYKENQRRQKEYLDRLERGSRGVSLEGRPVFLFTYVF